jgi:hypothetical protein
MGSNQEYKLLEHVWTEQASPDPSRPLVFVWGKQASWWRRSVSCWSWWFSGPTYQRGAETYLLRAKLEGTDRARIERAN